MTYISYLVTAYFLVAVVAFSITAFYARKVAYFQLDLIISRKVQKITNPLVLKICDILTAAGLPPWVNIWMGLLVVIFFIMGKLPEAATILTITLIQTALFFGFAKTVRRARPTADLINVKKIIKEFGFPSGHVLLYVMVFGFLLYLSLGIAFLPLKILVISVLLTLIVMSGLSRIHSGQHWPSDVLGGYLLGSLGLIIVILIYNLVGYTGA